MMKLRPFQVRGLFLRRLIAKQETVSQYINAVVTQLLLEARKNSFHERRPHLRLHSFLCHMHGDGLFTVKSATLATVRLACVCTRRGRLGRLELTLIPRWTKPRSICVRNSV